jgi:hypothetical protein
MAELTSQPTELAVVAEPVKPPAKSWCIAAIASLGCGLFLIVPFFAGLAALAMGIVGIRQINASGSTLRGRRLAVAGIVLGLVNVVGWSAYFTIISEISSPGRAVAQRFIADLNSGNPRAAQRDCVRTIVPDQLSAASDQVRGWGGVKSVAVLAITSNISDGVTTGSVHGTARTGSGTHAFELSTVSDDDSNWKVAGFSLR